MSAADNIKATVGQSKIPGAGRGLFALEDLAPGDIVVAVSRPLVAELETERMLDTCGWCFQRGATNPMERKHSASMGLPTGSISTKACSRCKRVSYCSEACHKKAWKREHKYECKVLNTPSARNAPDLDVPHQIRGVTKLLARMMDEPEGKNIQILETLKFHPAAAGIPAVEEIRHQNEALVNDLTSWAQSAWLFAGKPGDLGDGLDGMAAARALMFNVGLNTFGIASPLDDVSLGRGFDPLICSANHSCEPNVELVINQPEVVLRAMRPIRKGEEVYMKYTDTSNPFSVRQAKLKKDYYFSCQCPKCKKGAVSIEDKYSKPPEELAPEYCELADKLVQRHKDKLGEYFVPMNDAKAQERLAAMQAEAFAVSEKDDASFAEVKGALKMCIDSGMWSWTRQPVPELCRKIYAGHIEAGNPYRAFRVGCKMHFDIAPTLYPQKFAPDHLTNVWALSVITNVICGPNFAHIYKEFAENGLEPRVLYFGFLLDLHDNVPRMFGWDSPFGRVVKFTYDQIMGGASMNEADIRRRVADAMPNLSTLGRSVSVDSL